MDPNATWKQIIMLLRQLDDLHTLEYGEKRQVRIELVRALHDLADWLYRGGFPPEVSDESHESNA